MDRRTFTIILSTLVLVIIAGGVLTYFVLSSNTGGSTTVVGGPTQTQTTGGPSPVAGNGCGVTKTADGYKFSWLHVAGGALADEKNCIVTLKGFNWSQLEFGTGVGGGPKTRISEASLAWFSQNLHTNVWRIPLNSTWWNQNVDVPMAGMSYQAWIQQVVKWVEQTGNYVILTKGPQFLTPPCGKGPDAFCPPQNNAQAEIDAGTAGPEVRTTGQYIDPAVKMWTSVANIYANDPAVLYDSWNEMHDIDAQTWQTNTNTLIATIRQQNPRSVIFLGGPNFKGNINALVQGTVPDFTQANLVYDFHVYDGFNGTFLGKNCSEPNSYVWRNWPNNADAQVNFSQQKGKAVSFSEWGGCNDVDDYNQAITTYARTHHITLTYYDETNVAKNTGDGYQLTPNGIKVQAAYATL